MKTKIISLLFILVLTLSACSGGSPLEQNRAKWEGQNIDHYRYTVAVSCFCIFAGAEVTYEVQNGQVVNEIVKPHPDRQIDIAEISGYYQEYNTIDKVFDYLDKATKEADEVKVEYDPTYGFPTSVVVDQIKEATDDENYITLSNFEPLP